MSYELNVIKQNLGDLARPNKFKITIPVLGGDEISILAKAGSLPGKTIGAVEAFCQGRKIPLAGDTSFAEWSCTFYVDPKLNIREKLEKISNDIDDFGNNKSTSASLKDYGKDIIVEQLDRAGATIKKFTLHAAWPSSIAEVALGADSNDSVEELEVTWTYVNYELA